MVTKEQLIGTFEFVLAIHNHNLGKRVNLDAPAEEVAAAFREAFFTKYQIELCHKLKEMVETIPEGSFPDVARTVAGANQFLFDLLRKFDEGGDATEDDVLGAVLFLLHTSTYKSVSNDVSPVISMMYDDLPQPVTPEVPAEPPA